MNINSPEVQVHALTATVPRHGCYLPSRIVLCEVFPGDAEVQGARWAVWEEITPDDPDKPRHFAQGDYFTEADYVEAWQRFGERSQHLMKRARRAGVILQR